MALGCGVGVCEEEGGGYTVIVEFVGFFMGDMVKGQYTDRLPL